MPGVMSVLTWPNLPSSTSIRLFTLTAGNLGDPIVGSLSVVDLEDRPAYECVSYTWGDAGEQEELLLNGFPVQIRRHLWEALRRMRLSIEPRVLWIDAICISQYDLDEKARQVQMIGKIVHHASRVLAWLGEHADGSEAILRGWPPEDIVTANANISQDSFPLSFWTPRFEVWLAFCSRPWFSRTWIIQEVVVAKEVLVFCGEDVGHWTTLFENPMNRVMRDGHFHNFGAVLGGVKSVSPIHFREKVVAFLPKGLLARCEASFKSLAALVDTRGKYQNTNQSDEPRGLSLIWFSSNAITSKCLDRRDKIYAPSIYNLRPKC